jgi:hypothetical protein
MHLVPSPHIATLRKLASRVELTRNASARYRLSREIYDLARMLTGVLPEERVLTADEASQELEDAMLASHEQDPEEFLHPEVDELELEEFHSRMRAKDKGELEYYTLACGHVVALA